MFTVVALIGLIFLLALAAADLWIADLSSDELAQMGLQR